MTCGHDLTDRLHPCRGGFRLFVTFVEEPFYVLDTSRI